MTTYEYVNVAMIQHVSTSFSFLSFFFNLAFISVYSTKNIPLKTNMHTSTLMQYITPCAFLSRTVTQPCNEDYKSALWTALSSPELLDIHATGVRQERGGVSSSTRGEWTATASDIPTVKRRKALLWSCPA